MEDPFRTIEWKDDHIRLLDQTLLPQQEKYIAIRTVDDLCDAIKRLAVRGAPAIGVAAAMGVALGMADASEADRDAFMRRFDSVVGQIWSTRPTAVNLFWALNRMKRLCVELSDLSLRELKLRLAQEAVMMEREDRLICERIGFHGRDLLENGDIVLTHCNAGGLATAGYGTAIGVIRAAFEAGKGISVISDETRPLNQGSRITAWELKKLGVPVTLITDNRIAANGDAANKIGTYSVAVLAKHHRIPFYVAAPLSTIDMSIKSGADIPIEERDAREVTSIGGVPIAPDGIPVRNLAFDVTPHELISGIITEHGIAVEPYGMAFRAFFAKEEERLL